MQKAETDSGEYSHKQIKKQEVDWRDDDPFSKAPVCRNTFKQKDPDESKDLPFITGLAVLIVCRPPEQADALP